MSENLITRKRELKEIFKKYDWKENKLNGKVKSVITVKHNLTVINEKIINDNTIYKLDKKVYESFDIKGNIIESSSYDSRGVRTVLLIPSYDLNEYINTYKYFDDNDVLISECFLKYLKNGNVIEKWENGKTVIEYNFQENTILQLFYDTDNNLIWKDTYKYDTNRNLVEFCNDLGKTICIVNTLGNDLEEIKYDSNKNITEKKKYKYKLDKYKNWIEKKEYQIENNIQIPKTLFERKIKYY